MIIELFVLILFFCLVRDIIARDHGLPPGDGGLPIIGALPRNADELHKIICEQKKKYGSILCLKIRCKVAIILTEFKLIKYIFLNLENLGKFQTFSLQNLDLSSIIVGVKGSENKFSVRNGIYRQRVLLIEKVFRSEVKTLADEFSMELCASINITRRFTIALLSVIWTLNNDKSYKQHSGDVQEFYENVASAGKIIGYNRAQLDLVPWLKNLLPELLQLKIMSVEEMENTLKRVHSHFGEIIGSHKRRFENKLEDDFMCHLVEELSLIHPELLNTAMLLYKLILKNSEHTTASIFCFLQYMCFHPEVQGKIHEEIDSCIPRNRLPLLSDQEKLPFLNATFHEVNRCSSSQPTGIACMALEDAMISGFKIPKGSLIHPHVESCHHDPKYFENPSEFRPSRFLSKDGSFNNKKEGYLPFHLGQRPDWPVSISDMALFLFISSIMQRFKVSPKDIEKKYTLNNVNSTMEKNIIFYKRM